MTAIGIPGGGCRLTVINWSLMQTPGRCRGEPALTPAPCGG